jgi:hypothetical protein
VLQFTFTATGGTGVYSWQLSSGTLPSGLALSSGGELVGTPTEAGSYTFEVKVSSGSQEELQSVSMEVVKPQLIVADIVAELLGSGSGLSAGDISFLDLIGNNNGRLDLGDFLAWLADSGVTASPGVISQVMKTVSNRTAAVREQQ